MTRFTIIANKNSLDFAFKADELIIYWESAGTIIDKFLTYNFSRNQIIMTF